MTAESSAVESGDAMDLASGFASGRMHPRTVLEFLLARIERIEPLVGACNDLAPEAPLLAAADAAAARWRAAAPYSPLDGVPFGVKANIAVAGLPWHAGIAAFRNRVAGKDAVCVARLRAAGLIPVATLNMHEAALGVTSDNPAFRTTSNPWALERIPGGSSGGSAAAVASGMLPLALGTDDLGSVRLPSALCGVVGFKPAHGAISTEGVVPLSPSLDHVGIHARSVRDVVAILPILSGQPNRSSPSGRRPTLTRWMLRTSATIDQPVAEAMRAAMSAVDSSAAPVDWADVDLASLRRAGLLICERDAAHHFNTVLRQQPEGFSAEFRHLVGWGASQEPVRVGTGKEYLETMRRRLRDDLRSRLLLAPTTPHTAPRQAVPVQPSLADFTAPPAVAGVPAISLPAPRRDGGLPVGIQLTGALAGDVLYAAAGLFPEVAPVAHPSATDRSSMPCPASRGVR